MTDSFSGPSLGGIKQVLRGVAGGAGTIRIPFVNTSKAYVISVSKGSAGTVATNSVVNGHTLSMPDVNSAGNANAMAFYNFAGALTTLTYGGGATAAISAAAITGGTTNLTVAQYSAVLTSTTTIVTDGPCEWQLIEFS